MTRSVENPYFKIMNDLKNRFAGQLAEGPDGTAAPRDLQFYWQQISELMEQYQAR